MLIKVPLKGDTCFCLFLESSSSGSINVPLSFLLFNISFWWLPFSHSPHSAGSPSNLPYRILCLFFPTGRIALSPCWNGGRRLRLRRRINSSERSSKKMQ